MKYIFGASGHAKVVLEVINSVNDELVLGVFDDNKHIESFLGIPFLGKYKNKKSLPLEAKMVVSIGDNKIRKKL